MAKSYNQYCPIAHALDVVGERWSLLVIRELLAFGPLRYSDLHSRLDGCGTNILASRLKELERAGVLRRRRLPPPAAATVYELTEYGEGLRAVMHQLAHWGARSLEPPTDEDELAPGWLTGALRTALPSGATEACIEFRIGDDVVSLRAGDVREGPSDRPDAVVEGDPAGLFHFFVDRDVSGLTVTGKRSVVEELLETLPCPVPAPVPAGPEQIAVT